MLKKGKVDFGNFKTGSLIEVTRNTVEPVFLEAISRRMRR